VQKIAISLKNVSFGYSKTRVLDRVNLSIPQGEFWALIGPNGGGKTTLLKLILGLLKPWEGEIKVFGKPAKEIATKIGYVPQQVRKNMLLPLTVFELVSMGVRSQKRGFFYASKTKEQVQEALEKVGISSLASKSILDISGGQFQRALVARALVGKPEILIFDEPTANVDPEGKVCLYELLSSLKGEMTVVVVTHDLVIASASIDGLAVVNRQVRVSREKELSSQLLSLIYGKHTHACAVDGFIQEIPKYFASKVK
jgi:zinc transport system ATP-binding protein